MSEFFDDEDRSQCCLSSLKVREPFEWEEGTGGYPWGIVACKVCNKKQWSIE